MLVSHHNEAILYEQHVNKQPLYPFPAEKRKYEYYKNRVRFVCGYKPIRMVSINLGLYTSRYFYRKDSEDGRYGEYSVSYFKQIQFLAAFNFQYKRVRFYLTGRSGKKSYKLQQYESQFLNVGLSKSI